MQEFRFWESSWLLLHMQVLHSATQDVLLYMQPAIRWAQSTM